MQNPNPLIEACLQNDRKAQKALYEQYFQYLMSICYRYEHNSQDAVAIVNQAFLKIILNLESFDQNKPFLPWIKRITVNVSIDHIRKKKSTYGSTIFLDEEGWEKEGDENETIDENNDNLIYEDYILMMEKLEEPTKTIFNLYAIDEYSHKEIAEKLNISERTSKRYLSKAREALKSMIAAKKTLMKGA